MESNELFTLALGLGGDWKVVGSRFEEGGGLSLDLDFEEGRRFACPECGCACPVHDTAQKRWRHMDFWQHRTELRARVPRVRCGNHGVLQVAVPWARAGSGFTLMMEAMVLLLCKEMAVSKAAAMLGEHDTRLWRVLEHYVLGAHRRADWSGVRRVQVDETSARKGHRYLTSFVDADTGALLLVLCGRSAAVFERFVRELELRGGSAAQIELVVMDMSKAYRAGAARWLPSAQVVFDRFHIMQLAGKALDEVCKAMRRVGFWLKGQLWAMRGNESTRSPQQLRVRELACKLMPKIGRAHLLRQALQEVLEDADPEGLSWWLRWADRCRLEPFRSLSRTLKEHRAGVEAFMRTRLTNAAIEAVNGLIQLAKRIARGFRNFHYFQIAAYLKAGKLNLSIQPT